MPTQMLNSEMVNRAQLPLVNNILDARFSYLKTPRCADVPTYDSVPDSPIHWLSFRPIPVVVGALTLKRWVVQVHPSSSIYSFFEQFYF